MRRGFHERAARLLAASAMALLAAACATTSPQQTVVVSAPAPVYTALPGLTPAERVEEAVSRLRNGQKDQARAELKAALAQEPENKSAQKLLTSLDADPRATMGEKNYVYTVRKGETLWSISKRLMGDPLMFYALARYNEIEVPESVVEGEAILIPGLAPPKPTVATPARKPAVKAAPAVQAKAANPAEAGRLRRAALEHMSRGRINQAETLLQQASNLDPANATIRSDLDRARRIQASVKPRS